MDNEDTPGNVTQIKDARSKKKKKEEVLKPAPLAELYQSVAGAIERGNWSVLPQFPRRLVVYSENESMRVIGELLDGDVVVLHASDTPADAAIMSYCNKELGHLEEYRWTARQVKDCRDFWILSAKPLADVKQFRWLSEPGYTFNRLPWDQGVSGETPTWDRLLGRVSNRVALRRWIGSLFVEDSDTHQYLWLFGQGGDGKGAINRFLSKVFGGSYCAKQVPKAGDRFWTFGLIGKRLVVFPDCNDVKFVADSLFKSLTGGDPVEVEAKQKMSFTFRPTAKYFFFSNEKPKISSEPADTRRIIYCEFEPQSAKADPHFEDRLWAEGGAFLTNCIAEYSAAHPFPGPIACDDDQLRDHLSVVEERFEVIYDKHLCRPAVGATTSELNTMTWEEIVEVSIVPQRMQHILGYYFRSNQQHAEFLKWLEINHGVKKKTLHLRDGREPKVYVGVSEKANATGFSGRTTDGRGTPFGT